MAKHREQIIEQRRIRLHRGLPRRDGFFEPLIGDQEQQIALVRGIEEHGAEADAGAGRDLAQCGIVKTLRDKQLARSILDAIELVALVAGALAERRCRLFYSASAAFSRHAANLTQNWPQ